METLLLFTITFAAAFAGVFPPGLVNMSVVKMSLERTQKDGLLMAVGASVTVFFQALLGVVLARYIFRHPDAEGMLLRTALVILAILFVFFIFQGNKKKNVKQIKSVSGWSFFKGLGVSAINLFPIPFFMVLSTLQKKSPEISYTSTAIFVFSLAACLGTLFMLYLYIVSFAKLDEKLPKLKKYSNFVMAILMLILILVTSVRIYYG